MDRNYVNNFVAEQAVWQAQSAAVDTLLNSWEREIELDAERLREEGQRIEAKKTEDAIEAQRTEFRLQSQQDVVERLDANALGRSLEGLAIAAEKNDNAAVSIPSGIKVASALLVGPAIGSLLDKVEDEVLEGRSDSPFAQSDASIRWALGHGMMPHPTDLASSMQGRGLDRDFATRFSELGQRLDQLSEKSFRNPQLQGVVGHERLGILKEHVQLLGAYSSQRLVSLVRDPEALKGTQSPTLPVERGKGQLRPRELNQMLDKLFS
ncbi:MAG: hypothetical protein HY791_26750 [Deltaproteobacteria bacterium]|nr:hypothetical protein [Deltaproteobacteria bacterium]